MVSVTTRTYFKDKKPFMCAAQLVTVLSVAESGVFLKRHEIRRSEVPEGSTNNSEADSAGAMLHLQFSHSC